MRVCLAIVRRDLRLAARQLTDTLLVLFFFVIVAALFPIAVGPEPRLLARMAPGVLWVAALLTAMLSFDRLFLADFEDGTLDQMVIAPCPLPPMVGAKFLAHWLSTAVPLLVVAPLIGVMLQLQPGLKGYGVLLAALALGTAAISLIGGLGAALVVGVRRGGVLLALLVLPLLIPVLIFGTSAVEAALMGYRVGPHLMLLAAMFLGGLALCPWGAAAALRVAVE